MNELNYASLEASKRLVDTGIEIDTDCRWQFMSENPDKWEVVAGYDSYPGSIPAPSMAEIWRELKTVLLGHYHREEIQKKVFLDLLEPNPTDALIDLLIWTKRRNTNDIWYNTTIQTVPRQQKEGSQEILCRTRDEKSRLHAQIYCRQEV